ncbi:septation ring formation regulator EzrA [Planococcus sp. CP5-4]|uniref:septation ring formation regulator EzrA n=1 Tax=unclassified Planococcus (in: firmicutes) TaxID=2662419 RepID=UPI001C24E4C6|nr:MULTISPECIES: septation ring formation regulator EzrA [unclassified Planococcus (in: firmicutes)]MBU9673011.1 septation ring formation regulator EzrA [Planococcus sp. CP5-4_YE]MBV0908783.1 septation ring formation regulator EzrA [Planococcus sp. CP5-4_UN]MBW6063552.1 septation ring formation regulator EzrA [Planococcus sp. CP5-4]
MMEYIIIAVIILLALLIIGMVFRKKHNAEIERLEQLKLQLKEKPIMEELTKVKQLNLNGQTEEMFERWRNKWDEIMDVDIPKIDATLYDAEESIKRFNFPKASKLEKQAEVKIDDADQQIAVIFAELDELIGSEEKNRSEMDLIQEKYVRARKNLLAHKASYGAAAEPLEKRLESFVQRFEEYDQLTGEGNYLRARETVINLSADSMEAFMLVDDIPMMLTEIDDKIPQDLTQLRQGKQEMEEQSYYLNHLGLTEKIEEIEQELAVLKKQLETLEVTDSKDRVDEIKDRIDAMYDLLEKEVAAKHYIDQHLMDTERHLQVVARDTQELEEESRYVQHSYKITDQEAAIPKTCLEKVEQLAKRFELLANRLEEDQSAYSSLQDELMHIREDLTIVDSTQMDFTDALKNLRVEENKARIHVEELRRRLQETDRMLHKANIPGIPEDMDVRLEEAEEHLFVAMRALREVPLNMKLVDNYMEQAETSITDVEIKAKEMVENVLLVERIIQYGNRYRKTNPQLHAHLLEAEESFRQMRYTKALEEAATAVENFEPGSMKRIEVLVKDKD